MSVVESSPLPIAATRLWCVVCRAAKPFRNKVLAEASRQRQPNLHGENLVCVGCDTTLVTCYVDDKTDDKAADA